MATGGATGTVRVEVFMSTTRVPPAPMPTRPATPVQAHAHPAPKPESVPQSQEAEQAKEGASTGDGGASAP